MATNLRRAREMAWHFALVSNNKAAVGDLEEFDLELSHMLRDLADELDTARMCNRILSSLEQCAPQIAGALDKSARAAELWKEGLVDALARKDAEIEMFQNTIGDQEKENARLLRLFDDLEWCGWSAPCSGADCCPWCRASYERGHAKDCLFTKVKP